MFSRNCRPDLDDIHWHTFDHHSSCLLQATPLGTSTANWPDTASNITILMLQMAKTSGKMMHTNPFSKVALREKRNTSKACKNPTSYPQADSSSVAKHMQMVYKQNQSDAQVVSPWPYQHMQLQYSKSLRLGLPQWPRAHSSYHNRLVDHLQITNYFLRLEDPKSCRTMPWLGRAECRFHIVHPCVCHVWDLRNQNRFQVLGRKTFFWSKPMTTSCNTGRVAHLKHPLSTLRSSQGPREDQTNQQRIWLRAEQNSFYYRDL